MKTIISASRRTDIPAYYLEWFMDAIRKGEIEIHNPLYRHNRIKVKLSPEDVEWIVFWSRSYGRFLKNYDFFSGYELFFHFTIVSHDKKLEKTALSQIRALKQMEKLVTLYGPGKIIWRYDPIVIWSDAAGVQSNFNENEFALLCEQISQLGVNRCYFSFVTTYRKFIYRMKAKYPDWQVHNEESLTERQTILRRIKNIAMTRNIILYSCCNDRLVDGQIRKGSCISGQVLNRYSGSKKVSEARTPTRTDCGCTRSVDVGDYLTQPCFTGCIYCYANPVWQ